MHNPSEGLVPLDTETYRPRTKATVARHIPSAGKLHEQRQSKLVSLGEGQRVRAYNEVDERWYDIRLGEVISSPKHNLRNGADIGGPQLV